MALGEPRRVPATAPDIRIEPGGAVRLPSVVLIKPVRTFDRRLGGAWSTAGAPLEYQALLLVERARVTIALAAPT